MANQLRYNDATNVVRKELPSELELDASTAIYITIYDDAGNTLLAREAATLYADTTLNGAITAGDSSFVLAAESATLEPGDRIRILDSDDGPPEDIVVDYYDSANLTVHAVDSLYCSHTTAAVVVGMFATATIDTTDTDDFPKNGEVIFAWEHAADEFSKFKFDTDLYKISWIGFGTDDAIDRYQIRFADIYDTVRDRIVGIKEEALREIKFEMLCVGMDIDRIIDQEMVMIPLVLKMGLLSLGYSDTTATEREMLATDYGKAIDKLQSLKIWTDDDQDLVKEDDEVDKHIGISYVRGL